MPLSTAAKIAMCVCPSAVVAGAVAGVPPVKRAVHHLTAPQAPRHSRHVAAARPAAREPDCPPSAIAALSPAPIITYAAPIPAEPAGDIGHTGGPGGNFGGLGVTPTPAVAAVSVPSTPTSAPTPIAEAVPEPATWLLMIGGVGLAGAALRRHRRRRQRAMAGGEAILWSGGAVAEVADTAAALAAKSATGVAGKTTLAGVAGKAALCVCPAAVIAGSVMTVPPVRHAVHAATAPASLPAAPPASVSCADGTVPVSAADIGGFPETVATVPAKS